MEERDGPLLDKRRKRSFDGGLVFHFRTSENAAASREARFSLRGGGRSLLLEED
jgi:hypothetical protein